VNSVVNSADVIDSTPYTPCGENFVKKEVNVKFVFIVNGDNVKIKTWVYLPFT